MSNVPKLRFKEFSGEWEEKSFRDLVKLQRGSSPRPIVKYITKSEDGVNWIKIGDTKSNDMYIYTTEEKITKEGAEKSRKVSIGEIILSNSMSYGKPYILKIDGYIHDGWFVIRKFENDFNKDYLLQLLGSELIQKQYKRLAAGGVVSNISSELVNSVLINLPSKQEQEKIASFLVSVDTKIEQLTKKESLLSSYKNGVMQKIFSGEIRFKADDGSEFCDWEEKKLGDVGRIYQPKTISQTDLTKEGFDVYGANGIIGKYTEYNHEYEQIAVTCRGNTCGTVNFTKQKSWITGNAMVVNLDDSINAIKSFLYYQLSFTDLSYLITGSGQPQITGDIKNHKVNLPSIEEQTKIANFLSSIDSKIEQVQKQLDSTKEFKKALLQQMFV